MDLVCKYESLPNDALSDDIAVSEDMRLFVTHSKSDIQTGIWCIATSAVAGKNLVSDSLAGCQVFKLVERYSGFGYFNQDDPFLGNTS